MGMYAIVILVFVIFHDGKGVPFEVTDAGCSDTKTCKYFPEGCNESSDDSVACRLVTWKQADSPNAKIEIEIRGASGSGNGYRYVAMAFGRNAIMKDADAYFCSSVGGFETAAITTQRTAPIDIALKEGVQDLNFSTVNGKIHCKFERLRSTTKKDSTDRYYEYDIITEQFHLLIAEGNLNELFLMGHHTYRDATISAINFTKEFTYATPKPPTTFTESKAEKSTQPSTLSIGDAATDLPTKSKESTTMASKPSQSTQTEKLPMDDRVTERSSASTSTVSIVQEPAAKPEKMPIDSEMLTAWPRTKTRSTITGTTTSGAALHIGKAWTVCCVFVLFFYKHP